MTLSNDTQIMDKKNKNKKYFAPEVNTVAIQARQRMLTGSDFDSRTNDNPFDGTESYGDGDTNGWF